MNNNVEVISFPSIYPERNPIETFWEYFYRVHVVAAGNLSRWETSETVWWIHGLHLTRRRKSSKRRAVARAGSEVSKGKWKTFIISYTSVVVTISSVGSDRSHAEKNRISTRPSPSRHAHPSLGTPKRTTPLLTALGPPRCCAPQLLFRLFSPPEPRLVTFTHTRRLSGTLHTSSPRRDWICQFSVEYYPEVGHDLWSWPPLVPYLRARQ